MSTSTTTISMADVLVKLRERLIEALDQRDEASLNSIESALNAIEDTILALHPAHGNRLLYPVDEMISAIGDYFHGATAKTSIPDEADIRTVFANPAIISEQHDEENEITRASRAWAKARSEGKITREAFIATLEKITRNTDVFFTPLQLEKRDDNLLLPVTLLLLNELAQNTWVNYLESHEFSRNNFRTVAEKLVTDRIGQDETVQFETAQEIVQALVKTIH